MVTNIGVAAWTQYFHELVCLLCLFYSFRHILAISVHYPRESFREGLCNHRRWFVCLSVCLSVCYHDN